MIRRLAIALFTVCLSLSLWGCDRVGADIPPDVVKQALAAQAQQEQTDLWRQLSSSVADAPTLRVKKFKVCKVRQVRVVNELAYEVTGNYRYRLRYPNGDRVKQSKVPFSLILQSDAAGHWQLLKVSQSAQQAHQWQWQQLQVTSPTNADADT